MAKPAITFRNTKGTPLSYNELDANFTNLRDATITVAADGNNIVLDLNDTVTLTPGTNVTFGVSGNEITVNSSGGTSGVTLTTSSSSDQQFLVFNNSASETTTALETDTALYYYPDSNTLVVQNIDGASIDLSDNITLDDTIRIKDYTTSRRLESTSSFIITAHISSFGGTTTGPTINLDETANGGVVSIGTNTDPDDKIFLSDVVNINTLTGTQITGLTAPQNGDLVYNSTTNKFQGYANGAWVNLH